MQLRHFTPIILLPLIALITGCVPNIIEKREDPYIHQGGGLFGEAEALQRRGNHLGAALMFEKLALTLEPPLRQQAQLRAAEAYLRGDREEAAERVLSQIDTTSQPTLTPLKELLHSEVLLKRLQLSEAVTRLSRHSAESFPDELQPRFRRARAKGFELAGNWLESARELSELDLILTNRDDRLKNQVAIIQNLSSYTDEALKQLQPTHRDYLAVGWRWPE